MPFALEGQQNSWLKVEKMPVAAILFFFLNEAKNILMEDFMVMILPCKFEKSSYNIFFASVVTVKFLYTL